MSSPKSFIPYHFQRSGNGRRILAAKLGIGEDDQEAFWDEIQSDGALLVLRYDVAVKDCDEDGISVGAEALDTTGGSIRNVNDVEANLDIGDHTFMNDGDHLVLGAPMELACTVQRYLALSFFLNVVGECDETPFRVDIVRNLPDALSEDYILVEQGGIGRLAGQIEAHLGYFIVEAGDLVEFPLAHSETRIRILSDTGGMVYYRGPRGRF